MTPGSNWTTRLVVGEYPDRRFDTEFWQKQGDEACLVEYLIVGGYAVMRYSEPRFTKDLDIRVGHSPKNSKRVFDALARFGAPRLPGFLGTPRPRCYVRRAGLVHLIAGSDRE